MEIFGGAGAVKGVKAFRDLKRANSLLNFETIALGQRNKALVISKAKETRKLVLKKANLQVKSRKQENHIRGSKYFIEGKSELIHKNPQKLVDKFAGTGQKITNEIPGMPGYRERIDFGEVIGIYKNVDGTISKESTVGMIIYSKDGTHIVPLKPKK